MKKLLSVILALALILSLAALVACSKDEPAADTAPAETTPAETAPAETAPAETAPADSGEMTAEQLETTLPGEYLNEKLAAGMKPLLAFCACADNFFVTEQLGGGIRDYVQSLGFEYSFVSSDLDTALQISQMENYIEMGAAIIVALPMDGDIIRDVTMQAEERGTHVIIYGVDADFGIVATADMVKIGQSIAEMAIAWVDMTYPDAAEGEMKTAVMGQSAVTDLVTRTENMKSRISEDHRFSIVFESEIEDSLDVGFTRMEEAYTTDPEVKVVLSSSVSGSIGCNNYLGTVAEDVSGVGIFCCDYDSGLEEALANVANGTGFIRGSIIMGRIPASGTISCIDGILDGSITSPYLFLHPLEALTSADFSYSISE